MPEIIPITAVPNQIGAVPLGNQTCLIALNQRASGLYMDVAIGGVGVVYGVLCENLNPIIRDSYFKFPGDLLFFDTQGKSDPDYTGLGTRYVLVYLDPDEVDERNGV